MHVAAVASNLKHADSYSFFITSLKGQLHRCFSTFNFWVSLLVRNKQQNHVNVSNVCSNIDKLYSILLRSDTKTKMLQARYTTERIQNTEKRDQFGNLSKINFGVQLRHPKARDT